MININLELVLEYLLVPLFFGIVSVILYVRYRYSYSCQSCGSYLRNRNKVIKCRFCSMQLCSRCKSKGFCPRCSKALTREQQKKISRPFIYVPLSFVVVILSMILLITVGFSIGHTEFLAFGVIFFIAYICIGGAIFKIWSSSAMRAVKEEKLRGTTSTSAINRSSINPDDIIDILLAKRKRCAKCGTSIEEDIKFCPDCGTQV